ncbi:MAG: tRNA (guanosine(46)-N7)-methyltransferase TrmB [Sandaracinaceae bacterium]
MDDGPRRYGPLAPSLPDGRIDLSALVEGGGPLELDIGFGRGRSLFERAEAAPQVRLIGLEIKAKWAFKVEARLRQRGLTNVRAFHADALDALVRSGPEGCLQRVFVHFPDPWWKKRHAKRRVVGPVLLDELARLLAPGGELYVQTDVEERAADYRARIAAHPAFRLRSTPYLADNPFGARSNREVRAEEDGLPVYRILAERQPA